MKKSCLFLMIIITALMSFNAYSQTKPKLKLAILDPVISGEKLSEGVGIGIREIISGSFVNNADNYAIVERSMLNKVMEEANFSNTDAVDENQATRLGKLAGADKVVLTVISRVDNRCLFSIKMINVETATIDQQISKMVDYSSLLDVAEPLTLVVLGKGDINSIKTATSSAAVANSPAVAQNNNAVNNAPSRQSSAPGKFIGTGVTFEPVGYEFGYQPEEFPLTGMSRVMNNTYFNIVYDFSETYVKGMRLMEYAEMKGWNGDLEKDLPEETSRFTREMSSWKQYSFGNYPDAPITLVVKVREMSENGKENTSDFVFVDTATKEPLSGIRMKSKGGRFGSFANLLGDALEEDVAPKFRGKLKSAFKKLK